MDISIMADELINYYLIIAIQIYAIRFDDKDLLNQTFFNPYPIELISIADSGKGRNL